jgi:hypothetical protein
MSEKFEIEISDFSDVGGIHYYGNIYIPQSRIRNGDWHRIELDRPCGEYRTIRFWTIRDIITAAKEWFLKDPRVKPGDKLVINKADWKRRDERLPE